MMRVRFAPSPTGYLHLGNARTALFNYLLARRHQGRFVLRIEDTDTERSRSEYEAMILEDLAWLGIEWDEGPDRGGPFGPYRQSEKLDFYRESAHKLAADGLAYPCYCSQAELEEMRREQARRKESPRYDNRCRHLSAKQKADFERAGRQPVIRFRLPEKKLAFTDLIRGEITFDTALMGDLIILRSDGRPSFHLAVVLDDIAMEISHVVRGEDHISNTPRHIMLFEAFNRQAPRFAHMAMTLGPDGSRLSKRHGATSVRELKRQGYLPEAVFNYLALLGWGTTEDRDIYSREELVGEFSLERCKQGAAIFDLAKLTWMNGLYIQQAAPERLADLGLPYLQEKALLPAEPSPEQRARLARIIGAFGDRLRKISELPDAADYFFQPVTSWDPALLAKTVKSPEVTGLLRDLAGKLAADADFSVSGLEKTVREFCAERQVKTSQLFHPMRLAVSGKTIGPGLFETISLVGREATLARLAGFIRQAEEQAPDPDRQAAA